MEKEIKVKRHPNFINRIGEKHTTNEGFLVEIIEYINSKNVTVRFEDGEIVKNLTYSNIEKGAVKNPNYPCIYGIGYIGQGNYPCGVDSKVTKNYRVWSDMLRRCCSENGMQKQPTYKDATVCEEWHNFQNFAKWYEENWKPHMKDWQLDKDILVKGKKIYSPETCCFVPREINNLFTKRDSCRNNLPLGVTKIGNMFIAQISTKNGSKYIGSYNTSEEAFKAYKEAKELQIKKVANKWKNKIEEKVYQAMINYEVEITD